jgi:hypothetical protein
MAMEAFLKNWSEAYFDNFFFRSIIPLDFEKEARYHFFLDLGEQIMQIDVISWIEELSLTFMGIPDDQTHYL